MLKVQDRSWNRWLPPHSENAMSLVGSGVVGADANPGTGHHQPSGNVISETPSSPFKGLSS